MSHQWLKAMKKFNDSTVKVNTTLPSTLKIHDLDHVIVEDSQTVNDDAPKEKTIFRVVVDQVYGETEKFDSVMKEKGPHYLESNSIVYPNFTCTDDVIFPKSSFCYLRE